MKKYVFGVLASVFSIVLLAGCGSTKTMTCTRTGNQSGLKMDFTYKVTYKGKYIEKVVSTEKISNSNETLLNAYKEKVEEIYEPYKDVEHYKYNVTVKDNTLTSTAEIDYSKIDTKKMIEIDSANSKIIKNGKIKLADMKAVYEASGATCKNE